MVCDEYLEEMDNKLYATIDPNERALLLKEVNPYIIEQCYNLQLPGPNVYMIWQPWLKGYNGEVNHDTMLSWLGIYKFDWIDHELRKAMTEK